MTATETLDATVAVNQSARLPRVVYVLAAGTSLMGTTEFLIAGLLFEIAADLDAEVHQALWITAPIDPRRFTWPATPRISSRSERSPDHGCGAPVQEVEDGREPVTKTRAVKA
jgi:hypothetical protein